MQDGLYQPWPGVGRVTDGEGNGGRGEGKRGNLTPRQPVACSAHLRPDLGAWAHGQ